jgi:hypothetical protein
LNAPGRRDEHPVHHAAVHVVDEPHAGPAGGRHGQHHHHAGRQVVQVGAAAEPGDLGDGLEQRAEQQQPDQRLHERDHHERGLAQQRAQVAEGDLVGLAQREGHRRAFPVPLGGASPSSTA